MLPRPLPFANVVNWLPNRLDHLISIRFGWASGFFATVTWSTPLVSSAPIESTSIDSGKATVRVTLP